MIGVVIPTRNEASYLPGLLADLRHLGKTIPLDVVVAAGGSWDGTIGVAADDRGTRTQVGPLRLPYGDQGLLIRLRLFQAVGGYADIEMMEDVEMIRSLRRRRVAIRALPAALVTSGRRYQARGVLRTWLANVVLIALYLMGVPPRRLARWGGRAA